MFTGLIQSVGKILRIDGSGGEARLTIAPSSKGRPFSELMLGESIAVNGACLTVEKFDSASFSAFASGETLRLTNLGGLRRGDSVNLERALRLGDSLGGHLVSGHVDALCTLVERRPAGSSTLLRFSFPAQFRRQIIPKGSVAVDGVSLTVNACGDDFFEVNVIPATLAETTLADWKAGRAINLETDLIGKYVERMLGALAGGAATGAVDEKGNADNKNQAGLSLDFFVQNGF